MDIITINNNCIIHSVCKVYKLASVIFYSNPIIIMLY